MRRNIGARLDAIRKASGAPATKRPAPQQKPVTAGAGQAPGDDWQRAGAYTFVRELTFPSPFDGLGFDNPLSYSPLFLRDEEIPGLEELLFFDLETTGLSGGPGTVVFLAGFGRITGDTLRITQFFLTDYPGEPEFYSLVSAYLPESPYWISYNGKSFDAPMMHTKGAMNGVSFRFDRHGDLLHTSRRLWKRLLPSCSLSSVESLILGVERSLDIPGALAPEIYFEYLKIGPTPRLAAIGAHHYEDILSLAKLLAYFCRLGHDPLAEAVPRVDALGLGLLLKSTATGKTVLERGFEDGDPLCGKALALLHKSEGNYESALPVWTRLAEEGKDAFAAIELSKYCEHKSGDLESALRWANLSQSLSPENMPLRREETEKRIRRIQRKMERATRE